MKLGDLKGTSDYEYGSNMFEAFRSAVSTTDCEDVGSIGVAQYPWVKSDDRSTMVCNIHDNKFLFDLDFVIFFVKLKLV